MGIKHDITRCGLDNQIVVQYGHTNHSQKIIYYDMPMHASISWISVVDPAGWPWDPHLRYLTNGCMCALSLYHLNKLHTFPPKQ